MDEHPPVIAAAQSVVPQFISNRYETQVCPVCQGNDVRPYYNTKLFTLETAFDKTGCRTCSLVFCCVQEVYGTSPHLTLISMRSMHSDSFLHVSVAEQPHNDKPKYRFYKTYDLEIFTLLGSQECSIPFVGVRGDLVTSRKSRYLPVLCNWLNDCAFNHHRCRIAEMALPTRVLDVGTSHSDAIRLYITKRESTRYLALSHCWGGPKSLPVRTTIENLQSRIEGIKPEELPRNFSDAVQIARDLKVRYLWIDSLCIIQDDKQDWEIESSNMASIFGNAYLVIGASCACNSNEGFIATTEQSRMKYITTVENDDNSTSQIYARDFKRHYDVCNPFSHPEGKGPISLRGWTLQEQFLSHRMVHFEKTEIFWECRTLIDCECLEIEGGKDHKGRFVKDYKNSLEADFYKDDFPAHVKLAREYKIRVEKEVAAHCYRGWHAVVNSHHNRSLTFGSDFLPSLSGIITHLQKCGAGECLAGLWKNKIFDELLWYVQKDFRRAQPYRAPTWSWASIEKPRKDQRHGDNRINYDSDEFGSCQALCRIVAAACTPAGRDANGAVTSGSIIIQGKILRLQESHKKRAQRGTIRFRDLPHDLAKDLHPMMSSYLDISEENYSGKDLYGLVVGRWTKKTDPMGGPWKIRGEVDFGQWAGLILRSVDYQNAVYERVGMWTVDVTYINPSLVLAMEQVVERVTDSIVTIV